VLHVGNVKKELGIGGTKNAVSFENGGDTIAFPVGRFGCDLSILISKESSRGKGSN
jgi:hypothetical protein